MKISRIALVEIGKHTLAACAVFVAWFIGATPALALDPGDTPPDGTFFDILVQITETLQLLLPLAVIAALLFFFWGLVKFIYKAESDDARSEGRQLMMWGVVALFLIVSIWGVVGFIGTALGVGQSGTCNPPSISTFAVETCF